MENSDRYAKKLKIYRSFVEAYNFKNYQALHLSDNPSSFVL
jgi:hypothetical protein